MTNPRLPQLPKDTAALLPNPAGFPCESWISLETVFNWWINSIFPLHRPSRWLVLPSLFFGTDMRLLWCALTGLNIWDTWFTTDPYLTQVWPSACPSSIKWHTFPNRWPFMITICRVFSFLRDESKSLNGGTKKKKKKKISLQFNSTIYYQIPNLQTEWNFCLIQLYIVISDN